jgi:hypothetical protein
MSVEPESAGDGYLVGFIAGAASCDLIECVALPVHHRIQDFR